MPTKLKPTEFEVFARRWHEAGLPDDPKVMAAEATKLAAELRQDERRSQRAEADRDARMAARRDLQTVLASSRRAELARSRRARARDARLSAALDKAVRFAADRDRERRRRPIHRM